MRAETLSRFLWTYTNRRHFVKIPVLPRPRHRVLGADNHPSAGYVMIESNRLLRIVCSTRKERGGLQPGPLPIIRKYPSRDAHVVVEGNLKANAVPRLERQRPGLARLNARVFDDRRRLHAALESHGALRKDVHWSDPFAIRPDAARMGEENQPRRQCKGGGNATGPCEARSNGPFASPNGLYECLRAGGFGRAISRC